VAESEPATLSSHAKPVKATDVGRHASGADLRGIFVFRADSTERLRRLAADDPAIRSGRLVLDLFSWSAPAGIGEPCRRLAQQPGHRDSMVRLQLVLLKAGPKATKERTRGLHRAGPGSARPVLAFVPACP